MLLLDAQDLKRLTDMRFAMEAVSTALREFSAGRTVTPERTFLPVPQHDGNTLLMASHVEAAGSLGVKIVSIFPGNRSKGKDTALGVMLLLDPETGEPLALMDASFLTMLRTGAASGVATRYLAREDAKTLAVIGTGRQARGAVEAVLCVRPIREIRLYNRTAGKAREFAQALREDLREDCPDIRIMDSADGAAEGADVLIVATTSAVPVISPQAVGPGAHINGIGAYRPTLQEIPSEIVTAADKLVVETREGALEETGDLIIPIQAGLYSPDRIYGELGELIDGRKNGREHDRELTFFKSVGLAAMDSVVAKAVYDRAREAGVGRRAPLW